jgi:hypothetical protein
MSKVFICYSHKDKKYLDLLLKHFDNSLLDVWSDERIEGAEHWEEEIQKALESCNCGILILSANFFNSKFIKIVELEKLLQNQYEKNTYLLPILAEYCNIDKYKWISKKEILPKGFKAIENIKKRNHNKEIAKIVKRVEELLEKLPEQKKEESQNTITINYPDNIAENNFPTSNDDFFGREKYLNILDKAWDDEQVNILSFIAFGGIGKTSLIDNWLKKMKKDHYRGAKNIFMWSFYSQNSEEDRQVSTSEFLSKACKFFGIKRKNEKTPYEQAKKLADIISKQRVLLILDGLEPLQSSLEYIGEIKDMCLQVLLKRLSRQNKGLVIVTSRIKISSIDNQHEDLEKLEDYEGVELLKSFKLNGSDQEFEQISKDFDGHALSLKLLGSYTKVVLGKDISRINEIESLRDDKTKSSNHATRMLTSYKKYLRREGKIELDILKLLGFFDRAISFDVINVLKNKPLIENINNNLVNVSDLDWNYALNNLKVLCLISNNEKVLDTHPLVREYFSKYIEENFEDSYVKGHYRLYKYYEKLPKKEFPDTVEEMEPLFQSIYHGCKAKEYLDTFVLYSSRISRKKVQNVETFYLSYTLGEIHLELKIMSNYFRKPYSEFVKNLDSRIKSSALGIVLYSYILLGKYKKALTLINLEVSNLMSDDAVIQSATNHALLYLLLGNLNSSKEVLKKHIPVTLNLSDYGLKGHILADYAYINFLQGNLIEAEEYFKQAENSYVYEHRRNSVPMNYLASIMGYRYIKYLIYIDIDSHKLINRIKENMFFSKAAKYITDFGLEHILLAKLKFNIKTKEKIVLNLLGNGLRLLRKSNDNAYITEALIESVNIYRVYLLFDKSNEYLIEAYDLIIRSEAKLLLADWYIVAIQLALDEENFIKANTYFKEAKELSKELDEYFIFKEELMKLDSKFNIEVNNE